MTYLLLPPYPTWTYDVPRSPFPSPSPIFPTVLHQGKLEDPLELPLPNLEYPFIKDGLEVSFDIQLQEEEEEKSISNLDFGLEGCHGSSRDDQEDKHEELIIVDDQSDLSIPTITQIDAQTIDTPSSSYIDILPRPPLADTHHTHNHNHKHKHEPSTHIHNSVPNPLPLILRAHSTRLSASFINLFSPPSLGSHSCDTSHIGLKVHSDLRPRLKRTQSSPLPLPAMSFKTPEGQSSFDFGDQNVNISPWKGLRRALSLGSNASSRNSIASKRSTIRSSRQSKGAATSSSITTATSHMLTSSYNKGDHQRLQLSDKVISEITGIFEPLDDVDVSNEVDIEEEWHNNMVVWKEGESDSLNSQGDNSKSKSNSSSSHREDIPSGPSSPCDTDRFSFTFTNSSFPFPNPPNREEPPHLDSSPTDPGFPFHSTNNTLTNPQAHNTSSDEKEDEDGRITPISIVSTSSQPAYCPPSPALTPSPHPSFSNSPILTTPGVQSSLAPDSLTLGKPEQEQDKSETDIHTPKIDQYTEKQIGFKSSSSDSPLTPLIPRNITPPSSSTPPLSFPSRLVTTSTTVPTSTTDDNNNNDNANQFDTLLERTISENNDLTLQPPIVLSTHNDKISDGKDEDNDSMPFGEHQLQGREREWASYDNQDSLDPHPSQSVSSKTIPYQHHKAQPSVPYSTRTICTTISGGHNPRYSGVDPLDTLSPPPSYGKFSNSSSSSRRNSKYTAFSGSSGSSIYSYSTTDSSSYRGHNQQQHWQFGGQPDISTVFEEENSVDFGEQPQLDQDQAKKNQYEFGIKNTEPNHQRFQTLNSQSSSNTLVNRPPTKGCFSRERSGTINSQSGTITSNHSGKSTNSRGAPHPFANAVVRPTSPIIPTSKSHNNFLSPQHPKRSESLQYPSLSSSRSSPNLTEQYKMSQPTHQLALVSTEDDKDDEETCPVCVESLSFTYRLPGEKPHIVPECGHALHEECFVTVYGDVPPEGSKKILGVCGVCRQPMKMADGVTKRDKLAVLMGQPGQNGTRKPSQSAQSTRSVGGRGQNTSPAPSDPNADDPIENGNTGLSRSMHSESSQSKVVVPSISIRSEFPSITKGHRKGKQVITAMVTVEVPSAGDRGKYPTSSRPPGMSRSVSAEDQISPQLPPSPRSASDSSVVPSTARSGPVSTPDPFAHVVHDLKHRVVDYKTSGLDQLGSLRLFDLLCVRKGQLVREFHVYLFQEALICVSEEKKSGFRGIFSSSSSVRSDHSGGSHHGRGVLKLKGRIYVRHVKKVIDTSVQGELSLTITMEDESLDSFILCFKDRSSHETWRSTINRLLEEVKGGQNKASRLMGPSGPRSTNAPSSAGGSSYGMGFDMTSPSTAGYAATPSTSTFAHNEPSPGDLAFEQPLGPIHTPVDLVVVLSLPAPSSNNTQLPLKVKLMKSSLTFLLALLGPKDRISLITCEMGVNGIVRKTPFLSPCRYESRKRLEAFVETLDSGRDSKDEFEVQVGREERYDVVTAVNVALDVVLQRKAKNPISGMILVSDTSDVIKRAQMDLVTARLDAANVPVHALGYGRSHDPSPLWMISNHTHGTYTFVKEWYHLRDSLAGVVGGLMSIAMDNMKLHLSCQENDFHVTKVSGTTQAVVSKNGKDVDIELRELRYGEIREILVELDLEVDLSSNEQRYSGDGSSESGVIEGSRPEGSQHGSSIRKAPSFNVERGLGLDTLSVGDANALRDVVYEDALIDEVPVVEVDCSFHDPGAGRSVARLSHPVLLTVAILPPNAPPSSTPADPMIVRRRMELLASDMITRALLIASRKNFTHASRILRETKRIVETIVDGLRSHIHSNNNGRSKREAQTIFAIDGLIGTVQDLDNLLDGLEEHKELFERDHRNYSAQQAGVLRAQRSWTTRTPTERTYCTKEIGEIINLSGEWQGRS